MFHFVNFEHIPLTLLKLPGNGLVRLKHFGSEVIKIGSDLQLWCTYLVYVSIYVDSYTRKMPYFKIETTKVYSFELCSSCAMIVIFTATTVAE
jgi:hypothetical protein